MSEEYDPSTPSQAYNIMEPTWCMIDDILEGAKAIRCKSTLYLPQYPAEDDKEYRRRLFSTPWRPEFVDALESLASKPFGKEVTIGKGASAAMMAFSEDVDGRGNNLTAFAREVFRAGIAKGMGAILVDFPTMPRGATLADEKAAGARPYWAPVRADDILALYTTFVGSKEIISHVRIREVATVRQGAGEVCVERVRVYEPGRWELWQRRAKENGTGFELVDEGTMTIPLVPLALFWTGEREGSQKVKPPLLDLADMQIELYRKLSRQDEIETYAGSPMLQAQGVAKPPAGEEVVVGPKTILYAPAGQDSSTQPGFSYVSPNPALLTEIREGIKQTVDDMRRLAMQPMTQKSGTVTATATSVESAKAHSVVEAWALGLKDVLEQAFVFTSQWLGENATVEVEVNTDFSVEQNAQAPLTALKDARASGDLSHRDYLYGLRRFGVLPPDADIDALVQAAIDESPSPDTEDEIAASVTPLRLAVGGY